MSLAEKLRQQREAKRAKQAAKPKKNKGQLVINPAWFLQKFQVLMAKNGVSETDEVDLTELMTSPLSQLELLRTGKLQPRGFVELSEMTYAALALCEELYDNGTEATQRLMTELRDEILPVFGHMDSLQKRFAKTGKWGATGEEIQSFRNIIGHEGVFHQLIECSTRGLVCRALLEASSQMDKQFADAERKAA